MILRPGYRLFWALQAPADDGRGIVTGAHQVKVHSEAIGQRHFVRAADSSAANSRSAWITRLCRSTSGVVARDKQAIFGRRGDGDDAGVRYAPLDGDREELLDDLRPGARSSAVKTTPVAH